LDYGHEGLLVPRCSFPHESKISKAISAKEKKPHTLYAFSLDNLPRKNLSQQNQGRKYLITSLEYPRRILKPKRKGSDSKTVLWEQVK